MWLKDGEYDMDGYQYEKMCAQFLAENGFSNISVTPGSGDQGIDIIAYKEGKKYGVQCKYYTGSVGNKAIQEAYAGAAFYSCDVAMVITNATFSKPAGALASKLGVELIDGVDAIALLESSQTSDISDKDREQLKIERLERQLQDRYQALQAKFPKNAAKDKEITTQAAKMRSGVSELVQRFEERCNMIYAQMRWESFTSARDPKFSKYKKEMKETCSFYDKLIKERLEAADKYAAQCVATGVSEEAAVELVRMISFIYGEGGFSVGINDQIIAESKWAAKHVRIYEKWIAYEDMLPSKIQARDKAEEERELRYAKENLNNAQKSIKRIREELRALEKKAANEVGDITSKEMILDELGSTYAAAKERVLAAESDQQRELGPLKKRFLEIENELSALTEKKASVLRELAETSLLAFGQKKELRFEIEKLNSQIESSIHQKDEISSQIESIKQRHEIIIAQLKEESQSLENKRKKTMQEIERLKKRVGSNITAEKVQQKKKEIEILQESLPALKEQVKNAHTLFLEKRLQA